MTGLRGEVAAQIAHLRRYARALTGHPDNADDLVQECLARAYSRLHLWREGSDLRRWLFTIMHNLHVNAHRRAARVPPTVPLEDVEHGLAHGAVVFGGLDLADQAPAGPLRHRAGERRGRRGADRGVVSRGVGVASGRPVP